MFKILDNIVLNEDLLSYNLNEGDIGTIVFIYENENLYEVEFITGDGHSVAVITLEESQLRSLKEAEIFHAREMSILV